MFCVAENSKIGYYLSELIDKKYESRRQFCKAYLEFNGFNANDTDEIGRMANRLSQIIKGKKGVQLQDFPAFTQLLDVSCEEILSAGNCFAPNNSRLTNYIVAFSKDKNIWEQYINNEDKLILNSDEYGKTVIDYALKYKNYEFLKYLMENKYIWFVGFDKKHYSSNFGAGTSIEPRPIHRINDLLYKLAENHKLRTELISLAIENEDTGVLEQLRAREIPSLYQACYLSCTPVPCSDYYDEDMLVHIVNAGEPILDYFSEEFEIKDMFDRTNKFMFPYMEQLINLLIKNNNPYSEILLKKSIEHNKNTLNKLKKVKSNAINYDYKRYTKNRTNYMNPDSIEYLKKLKKDIKDIIMRQFDFYEDGSIVSFRDTVARDGIITNIICTHEHSDSSNINQLIRELNNLYDNIRNQKF